MSSNTTGELGTVSYAHTIFFDHMMYQATRLMTSTCVIELAGKSWTHASSNSPTVAVVVLLNVTVLVISLFIVKKIWQLLFSPMDVLRDIGSVGYVHHDTRIPKHRAINEARRQRKIGEIPPVYPNGWFRLLDSKSLTKGQLKSVFVLGEHLAVFRNQDDIVRVLDAHCPHMGANMAAGGRVVNSDCLQCPFHGWQFSGESGECVDIPYARKVPKSAFVRKWPVCEVNSVIYVWYHCDKVEPSWSIPTISNLGGLKYVGHTEHIVNSHVQEIPENAADFAHLGHLHKPVIGRDVENTYGPMWNLLRHDIEASWNPSDDPDHLESATMHIRDATHLKLWGWRIPVKTFHFEIQQIGPGNVHIYMNTPYFRGLLIQTITPTEPMMQRLCHSFYVDPRVPMVFAKIFFYLEATQIERDIMVWNNKSYLKAPMLLKEESAVARHRRWYKQFYSENSPRLNSSGTAVKNPLKEDANDW